MNTCIEVFWKSLNKYKEELCGDKVEVCHTDNSDIVILADGMGSGVKANILSTLTSKILGTMFLKGASIEDCVDTLAKTLPVCRERKVAYATFSILQIFEDGKAYLAEFDNPSCVFVRNGKTVSYPYSERVIEGKKIRESHFSVKKNDCFVLMSDGVIYAGAGELLNYGWTWESMAEYTLKCMRETRSAVRLANLLIDACKDLYEEKPGDDTTIAVVRVREKQVINIFTGPPEHKEDDEKIIYDFMHSPGKKVICGGTSANIAARVLNKKIITVVNYTDPDVPPSASMEGIDLVTEGVLTLGKTLSLLKRYEQDDFDVDFFEELDADNGASRLAKLIIEESTDIVLFVGKAVNSAHKDVNLAFDLSIRMNLVEQMQEILLKMGKSVVLHYY